MDKYLGEMYLNIENVLMSYGLPYYFFLRIFELKVSNF